MAHWGQGPAGPPPLGPEGFDWTAWHPDPTVVIGLAALAGLYLTALQRDRRDGRSVPPAKVVSFFGGLVLLLGALTGPLHDLSDYYLFSAHMVQHLLLTLVVPPLLLAGTPGWIADALLGRLRRRRALGALAHTATRPVAALGLYTIALIGCHLPGPYEVALEHHAWHVVEHLVLIATAILAWWPVLSPSALLPRLHYGTQILYLFACRIPMTCVAPMITAA